MKTLSLSCAALLVFFVSCEAQTSTAPTQNDNGEFRIYNNGLIYSDTTMRQLTHIVDSLNLKFKRCDLTRPYYAISQSVANFIRLEKGDMKHAWEDIKNNISFEDFVSKYKKAEVDRNMLVTKAHHKDDYSKGWVVEFSGEAMTDYRDPSIQVKNKPEYNTMPLKGKWVADYTPKSSGWSESLEAFYFVEEFKSAKVPEKYARMILYSDCVIDTTEDIYTGKDQGYDEEMFSSSSKLDKASKLYAFLNYIEEQTNHITEKDVPASNPSKWYAIDSMKKAWIEKNLLSTERFKQLLADAVQEAKEKKTSVPDEFDRYANRFCSKPDLLAIERSRRVIGFCSQDQRPRQHALQIAMLSAETVNWQVFLKAHLNIMNDRFERMTDGSYAYGRRQTYIKELEELNIEVPDLLLGICFRYKDPVEKHYFGSIRRLGRALAETKNKTQFEQQLLDIIKDKELDAYNRMLMHYLYLNYVNYLPNKAERMASIDKLKAADKTLPNFLASRIEINKKDFEGKD